MTCLRLSEYNETLKATLRSQWKTLQGIRLPKFINCRSFEADRVIEKGLNFLVI